MTLMDLGLRTLSVPLLALSGALAGATTYTGSGFMLVDATSTATGYASGVIAVTSTSTISSLNSVTLTSLSHTWLGDLEIDLYSPTLGTYVDLVSAPTLDAANFNGTYTFVPSSTLNTVDIAASGLSTSTDLAAGTYAMSTYGGGTAFGTRTDFSAFTGKALAGTWMLEVWDYSPGDTGSLGAWSFDVTPNPVPEPSMIAAFGIGALALVRRARKVSKGVNR